MSNHSCVLCTLAYILPGSGKVEVQEGRRESLGDSCAACAV